MTELVKLKIGLLCQGIRLAEQSYTKIALGAYPDGGKSRAGIAGSGRNFVLNPGQEDETIANIGVMQPFLDQSPYEFRIIDGKGWILENGKRIVRATIREPEWHSTSLFDKVQLHGRDSLALALTNQCIFKRQGKGCKFCIIDVGEKVIVHQPKDIAEAVRRIQEEPQLRKYTTIDGEEGMVELKDVNINSGALTEEATLRQYCETTKAIREVSDLPIGVQICPISRRNTEALVSAGVNEISFNLEVFSDEARAEVIPGKAKVHSKEDYLRAMREAVEILGPNQVESWMLIGLEPKEETIKGMEAIAKMGAIPLPKPFRPLYGAEYEKMPPPSIEEASEVYEAWMEVVKDHRLNPSQTKAGCGRCGACFPVKELWPGLAKTTL
jgi:hypothetical protein